MILLFRSGIASFLSLVGFYVRAVLVFVTAAGFCDIYVLLFLWWL